MSFINIPQNRKEILTEYGFGDPPICDLLTIFNCPTMALDTKMSVRGDHCDECAYVYYASREVDGELLDGLFYVPSLLEYLYFLGSENGWRFDEIFEELSGTLGTDTRLVFISGCPAIYTEVCDYAWSQRDLRFEISDMLKVVGVLDYILSNELQRMLNKKSDDDKKTNLT